MKKILLNAVFCCMLFSIQAQKLPVIAKTSFKKDSTSIVKFGAKADGVTLNTKSINAAIEAVHKKGGGVVVVPPGVWLTGPLVLKSNVNLCVQRAALLLFTGDK